MPPSEFDIIAQYFQRPATQDSVIDSIGDDCALLTIPDNCQLVMSMDTVVAGRHFPEDAQPYDIATRALCTSLSDLAAMGAKPLWFTLGLTLPTADEQWLAAFSEGLFAIADRYQCDLIGGDTTQGPLTVTVQVHGAVSEHILHRRNAKVGDTLWVTGCLGDGAAGLAMLLQKEGSQDKLLEKDALLKEAQNYLHQRFYAPEPQIHAGLKLVSLANAAIDISDGLLADVGHIAKASEVDIHIDIEQLPISDASKTLARMLGGDCTARCVDWALTGGDDYQLAFTVSEQHLAEVQSLAQQQGLNASLIGRVVAPEHKGGQVTGFSGGKPWGQSIDNNADSNTDTSKSDTKITSQAKKGYQHFAS